MDGDCIVGVDVGGTGLRAARVEPSGAVGAPVSLDLPDREVETVLESVASLVDELGPAQGVGVGMPGFVDHGTVVASPNFPAWKGVDLRARLEARLGCPVAVENDANMATLGAFAEQEDEDDLVVLTLGTGVGGGVVSGGQLLTGYRGTGGEVGHIFVGGDHPCGCGGRGCLETWCGTVGLVARGRMAGLVVQDGRALVRLADQGDGLARALLGDAGKALGIGLVTLVNVFNPRRVRILGGLAAAAHYLQQPAEGILHERGIRASSAVVEISWDDRADRLAIRGAAEAARRRLG